MRHRSSRASRSAIHSGFPRAAVLAYMLVGGAVGAALMLLVLLAAAVPVRRGVEAVGALVVSAGRDLWWTASGPERAPGVNEAP